MIYTALNYSYHVVYTGKMKLFTFTMGNKAL